MYDGSTPNLQPTLFAFFVFLKFLISPSWNVSCMFECICMYIMQIIMLERQDQIISEKFILFSRASALLLSFFFFLKKMI